jgi:hypothetical protein
MILHHRPGSGITLWPLAIDLGGNVIVADQPHGYTGPPAAPIDEFDYFDRRFGRRQVKMFQVPAK